MPSWNQVLSEIQRSPRRDALDYTRRKYLKRLARTTERNVIAYYSGWLQNPNLGNTAISDDDKNGLMAVIHRVDRSRGLDLLLHTPGGDLAATESIVDYLHRMFGRDIRAVIPQLSMSAGTMIACACRAVILGKQSSLGPIDPQFGGIPAHGVIKEFEEAIEAVKKDPASLPIWREVVRKYHPTFIGECRNALDWSRQIVRTWLEAGMFFGESDAAAKASKVVAYLSDHDNTKTHARHITINEAETIGLKVIRLEDNQTVQDLVLTVHHAFMHTFANSKAVKITENHLENAVVVMR